MGESIRDLKRVGEHPALDFSNTCDRENGKVIVEWLHDYPTLLSWMSDGYLLTTDETEQLSNAAEANPDEAAEAFQHALALRDAIYRTGSAAATRHTAPLASLNDLQAYFLSGLPYRRLAQRDESFMWVWVTEAAPLMLPVWMLATAAADVLITSSHRIRECAAADCGWLFLDTSRNHTRRWCDMQECGNREKAKRFYRRSTQK